MQSAGEEPLTYFSSILDGLQGVQVDFFALHSYSYGSTQRVDRNYPETFNDPPLQYQFYSVRMWEPLAAKLRSKGFEHIPIIITETNHQHVKGAPNTKGWDDDLDGTDWIRRVCEYIRDWNSVPGDQYVHGICFYRYEGGSDPFAMKDKTSLLNAILASGEHSI